MTYSGIDTILTIFDEDRNFPSTWRFKDLGKLGHSLLQYIRRADIDFSDYAHHRHVECQCDTKMLPKCKLIMIPYKRKIHRTCSFRPDHCSQLS